MAAEYPAIVRGETFLLSKAQLQFDSPNLLSEYFLSDQQQLNSNPREIFLSTNPQLFILILDHLCGYTILPIIKDAIPIRMTQENVLHNLRADASYYKLRGLMGLIDAHSSAQHAPSTQNIILSNPRPSPIFHFPGRVINWSQINAPYHPPTGYAEFPISVDLSKSFSITCWYKAASNKGWHTLISMEAPAVPRSLIYLSISPEHDFRFEIGVNAKMERLASGRSNQEVSLGVWTHLTFVQQVDETGQINWRKLYSDGKEIVSSNVNSAIYNPSPDKVRIAVMRSAWDDVRTAGFLGQAQDVTVFQDALDQDEIISRALRSNPPADDGWQTDANVKTGRTY